MSVIEMNFFVLMLDLWLKLLLILFECVLYLVYELCLMLNIGSVKFIGSCGFWVIL